MKVNVEFDCTPEEARRVMGLPDLTPVHEAFVAKMIDAVSSGGLSRDSVEAMMRSWQPLGDAGMKLWSGVFDRVTQTPPK